MRPRPSPEDPLGQEVSGQPRVRGDPKPDGGREPRPVGRRRRVGPSSRQRRQPHVRRGPEGAAAGPGDEPGDEPGGGPGDEPSDEPSDEPGGGPGPGPHHQRARQSPAVHLQGELEAAGAREHRHGAAAPNREDDGERRPWHGRPDAGEDDERSPGGGQGRPRGGQEAEESPLRLLPAPARRERVLQRSREEGGVAESRASPARSGREREEGEETQAEEQMEEEGQKRSVQESFLQGNVRNRHIISFQSVRSKGIQFSGQTVYRRASAPPALSRRSAPLPGHSEPALPARGGGPLRPRQELHVLGGGAHQGDLPARLRPQHRQQDRQMRQRQMEAQETRMRDA